MFFFFLTLPLLPLKNVSAIRLHYFTILIKKCLSGYASSSKTSFNAWVLCSHFLSQPSFLKTKHSRTGSVLFIIWVAMFLFELIFPEQYRVYAVFEMKIQHLKKTINIQVSLLETPPPCILHDTCLFHSCAHFVSVSVADNFLTGFCDWLKCFFSSDISSSQHTTKLPLVTPQ